MLEALLVVLIVVGAIVVGLLAWVVLELRRDRGADAIELDRGPVFAELLRDRVAVHLKSGETLEGVVTGEYPDAIALSHAVALLESGDAHALDGEPIVERRNIAYVQRLSVPSSAPVTPVVRDEVRA